MEKKAPLIIICLLTLTVTSITLYKILTPQKKSETGYTAFDSTFNMQTIKGGNGLEGVMLKIVFTPERNRDVEIDTAFARAAAESYRKNPVIGLNDTKLVMYSIKGIQDYMTGNFSPITAAVSLQASSGLEWQVGYCPIKYTVGGVERTSIAILPVLYNVITKKTYDYFECVVQGSANYSMYTNYYSRLQTEAEGLGHKSFIYDEGHLYP